VALDDLAIATHLLDGCTYFHLTTPANADSLSFKILQVCLFH
jgi:hypothetical protein